MAVYEAVAEKVCELGRATVDDLMPHFPGMTRKQIEKGLSNAKWNGAISCIEEAKPMHGYRGSTPGVYGPPPADADPDGWKRGMPADAMPGWVRPSASVWEYAQRASNEHHRRAA